MSSSNSNSSPLLAELLELARQARHASSHAELAFMAVNDSHRLAAYRQSALWSAERGVVALSGVVQVEANVPYVQWLQRVCSFLQANSDTPRAVTADDLPKEEGGEWVEWLPAYGLWLPLQGQDGGMLFARDIPWQPHEIALLAEWLETWQHASRALNKSPGWTWKSVLNGLRKQFTHSADMPWWKRPRNIWIAVVTAILLFPVRLTVLAPGELVPANPALIRAPFDGVVASFAVKPNEVVKASQVLFSFDQAVLQGRLEVARQSLATAEAEYRQAAQLAVSDPKYKGQLAILTGKIEERRAEADYLQGQLERANVVAPRDGIALFDDPSEWLGKPVVTGERIMRIAEPNDMEVEAWLTVADAIPLQPGSTLSLYLNATPLFPVSASVRYMAHDAVLRPDGTYAYRVRARLEDGTQHRVGLKGTAKLRGGWVPFSYWVLRRPLAAIRQFTGW